MNLTSKAECHDRIDTLFFGESVDRYQYEHLRPKGKFPRRRPTRTRPQTESGLAPKAR